MPYNPQQLNFSKFSKCWKNGKFIIIKSNSEEDIHKSIKYGVWTSTLYGNKILNNLYESSVIYDQKQGRCEVLYPIFLIFSVSANNYLNGVAIMSSRVYFNLRFLNWKTQNKWYGFFRLFWFQIKDIPNNIFENLINKQTNEYVIFSKDCTQI